MPQTYILWCKETLPKGLNLFLHVNQRHHLGKEQTYTCTCNKWLDVVFRMSIGFVQVYDVSENLSIQLEKNGHIFRKEQYLLNR